MPSLFESTKSDIQMTLNIFLRNGASITNLAEMIYCYPELKNKILGNVSKNNRIPLERYLERLNNPEEGAEKIDVKVLTETLNENLIPAFASIIEKNNLQINSYLKIKNLNEIFEYYNLKRKFYDKPFDQQNLIRRFVFGATLSILYAAFGRETINSYNWNWASKQIRGITWYK